VNFGGSNELAVVLALKEWGIPRQAVTLTRSGDTAGRLIALANRSLDATLFIDELEREGFLESLKKK